jgi:uncharacterized protein
VALLIDAGILYAQADRADPDHQAAAALLREERGALVTSEIVLAEADYLILDRLGPDVELAFLRDVAEGTFLVECLTQDERSIAVELAERYRDLQLGLADLSLVLLSRRYGSDRIATFDERGFRAVTPLQGGSFVLLPADS